jgi:hypothetical protein
LPQFSPIFCRKSSLLAAPFLPVFRYDFSLIVHLGSKKRVNIRKRAKAKFKAAQNQQKA